MTLIGLRVLAARDLRPASFFPAFRGLARKPLPDGDDRSGLGIRCCFVPGEARLLAGFFFLGVFSINVRTQRTCMRSSEYRKKIGQEKLRKPRITICVKNPASENVEV